MRPTMDMPVRDESDGSAKPAGSAAPTLFQQVLRAPFFTLPDALRALHGAHGAGDYAGRVDVVRGRHPLARWCARIAGLPPEMQGAPLRVGFRADAGGETWRRDFNGFPMTSRLRCRDGLLHERLGPLRFRFRLHIHEHALYWRVAGVRLLWLLPLPARMFSGVHCREREQDGRYAFRVEAALPLVGLLVRYEGWLERA